MSRAASPEATDLRVGVFSSTTSSSTALGAAVAAATDLLFSSSPAPAPSLTTAEELDESDGAGVATPFAVAEAMRGTLPKPIS